MSLSLISGSSFCWFCLLLLLLPLLPLLPLLINSSLFLPFLSLSCRGHGGSTPKASEKLEYSQTDAIVEDIPSLVECVRKATGSPPRFYVTHSWGGVMLNSYFARFPDQIRTVQAVVNVGSKRRVTAQNLKVSFFVDLV